jgi:hypothetical protein
MYLLLTHLMHALGQTSLICINLSKLTIDRLLSVPFSEVLMPGMLCLLPYVRSSSSLAAFKRNLKQFDLSDYLKGTAL